MFKFSDIEPGARFKIKDDDSSYIKHDIETEYWMGGFPFTINCCNINDGCVEFVEYNLEVEIVDK